MVSTEAEGMARREQGLPGNVLLLIEIPRPMEQSTLYEHCQKSACSGADPLARLFASLPPDRTDDKRYEASCSHDLWDGVEEGARVQMSGCAATPGSREV